MDLRFPDAEPTAAECRALDRVIAAAESGDEWEREHGGVALAAKALQRLDEAARAARQALAELDPRARRVGREQEQGNGEEPHQHGRDRADDAVGLVAGDVEADARDAFRLRFNSYGLSWRSAIRPM